MVQGGGRGSARGAQAFAMASTIHGIGGADAAPALQAWLRRRAAARCRPALDPCARGAQNRRRELHIDAMEATMLAAESTWRILRLEHFRLRELSATIMRTIQVDHWSRRDNPRRLLRNLIAGLQDFNEAAHRPKGVALIEALRQHPDMADFLDRLADDQAHCDRLLAQAMALLDAIERGDPQAADHCEAMLTEHHRLLLSHLEREDTVLHLHTSERLTPEEWSAVASSISKVLEGGSAAGRG
jgi:hemerythrin-like domain-containing protein